VFSVLQKDKERKAKQDLMKGIRKKPNKKEKFVPNCQAFSVLFGKLGAGAGSSRANPFLKTLRIGHNARQLIK
jgi:hypothetical protein